MSAKILIMLIVVAVILIAFASILKLMGCQTARQQNREERREERLQRQVSCPVVEVIDGGRLLVAWGPRDKRRREVILQGIEIPQTVASEAKAYLERMTGGGVVRIDYKSRAIFAADESGAAVEAAEMGSSAPITGTVYGPGNVCLQVEQLFAGLAKCNGEASDVMKGAEKAAKKNHVGIWKR
jgi:endonuclease YncB( thermonuclease family)